MDEAISTFEMAIKLKPDLVAARRNLGYCYLKMGDLKQGLALYEHRERSAS